MHDVRVVSTIEPTEALDECAPGGLGSREAIDLTDQPTGTSADGGQAREIGALSTEYVEHAQLTDAEFKALSVAPVSKSIRPIEFIIMPVAERPPGRFNG